jgi:hypothetical protein
MENFNKNSLKAAVKAYGPLHSDGKAEAEVKEALVASDKGYSAEQVDLIYAAIIDDPEPDAEPVIAGHIVTSEFRDKDDFTKTYHVGEDVSHFDDERKADLVSKGLAQAIYESDENA